MTEQHPGTPEDEADNARMAILRQFWMESMSGVVRAGANEREAALQMLVVAAAHVGKTCGEEGAAQLCVDQAGFYLQIAQARAEAAQEATTAQRH